MYTLRTPRLVTASIGPESPTLACVYEHKTPTLRVYANLLMREIRYRTGRFQWMSDSSLLTRFQYSNSQSAQSSDREHHTLLLLAVIKSYQMLSDPIVHMTATTKCILSVPPLGTVHLHLSRTFRTTPTLQVGYL